MGGVLATVESDCSTPTPHTHPRSSNWNLFFLAQLNGNLLQQEAHAGLSPPAETDAERGGETHCGGVTMGGDPHNNQPHWGKLGRKKPP